MLSNVSIALLAAIIGRGTTILLFAIVANRVNTTEAGAYALAINYLTLFVPISSLGLNDAVARDVAKDNRLAAIYLSNFGFQRLISGAVCYGFVALLTIIVFDYSADTSRFVLLMGLSIVPDGLNQLFQALFTAFERQAYNAIVVTISSVTNIGLTWWVLHIQADATTLAWVRLACASLGLCVNLFLMTNCPSAQWKGAQLRPKPKWIMSHLRLYIPFTLMVLFYTIEWRADLLILSAFRNESEIASYFTAQSLLTSLLLLLVAYRLAALPAMSRLIQESPERLGALHDRSLWYLTIIIVPVAALTTIFANEVLSVFNPAFTSAAGALGVLMLALLISFLNEPNGLLMIAAGHQRPLAMLLGASLTVNIVANLALAPVLGGLGAAIARVFSVTAFSIPNAILVSRRIRRHHPLEKLPHSLLAAGFMALVAGALRVYLPWWLACSIAVGVYIPAIIALKGVPRKDLNSLRRYGILQLRRWKSKIV